MSATPAPTISAPPTTTETVNQLLAAMAALSGVVTDYNQGSQVRTFAESVGSINEMQGVWTNAFVFQGMVYGAMAMFGITPDLATSATTPLTIFTNAGPASLNVTIPQGTIVQTVGGVQFKTAAPTTLFAGNSSVNVQGAALIGGTSGNVPASSITQLVSNLGYPLFVTNQFAPTDDQPGCTPGANAENLSQTLSRFAAKIASIPGSSPVAIANAAIGVSDPSSGETVKYSVLYEPWIAAGSGAASGTAGWNLIIDNGLGTASSGLITAVNQTLGPTIKGATLPTSGTIGYRDAGVPYNIFAVTPTYANVSISGTVSNSAYVTTTSGAIAAAVNGYFSLPFGTPAEVAQISTAVGNAGLGALTSLTVALMASGSSMGVSGVSCSPSGRVLLNSLNISLTVGP